MANWLYTKFVENQLIDTAAVDFDADVIKGALYRSSSYTPNQSTDEYLSDAGNPISTAFITVSVSGAVVDADDFTFGSVAAGAAIDVLVLYKDTGSAATSPLIAKYDINVTPDGNDITISVNNAGLFTLGDVLGVIGINNGGTGHGSKTAAFDALAPSTTKGDLIVHDGADNVRLAKGTDGHVLKANSAAATGLEWGTVDASPLTTKGDLYTFDTDDARLAKGADGTFLRANSATGTGLEWGAISAGDVPNLSADKITSGTLDGARIPSLDASKITSGSVAIAQGGTGQTTAVAAFDALAPSTSKGDLIAHDGTDNVRVGVGANNTVLLADSAVASGVKWSSVPAESVSAGTFPTGAFSFTTSVSAPIITATNTSVATEGANVVTNGTFDADANWSKGTGWTISGGVATKTAGTAANLSQSIGVAANQVVRIRFSYTRTAGTLTVSCGGRTHSSSFTSASASVDIYILATGTQALTFIADATFAGTVDAVEANIITPRTNSLNVPTFGTGNIGLGSNALQNLTTGPNNTAIGIDALRANTVGYSNVAIGVRAIFQSTSNNNTSIGYLSGYQLTTGTLNTYIGSEAGYSNSTGSSNVAIGRNCLFTNSNSNNVGVGYEGGYSSTSANNVFIGYRAGFTVTSGGANIMIGNASGGSETTNSNRLYIANSNTSTPLIFGQFSGTGAGLTIHSQNTAGVPLIVKGIASQSSNLQQWQDSTSAVLGFVSASGGLTINEQGNDADTRIEGDTDANLLFVDASADSVQIGSATTADSAKFYVLGKISGSGEFEINGDLNHDGSNVGFYGTAPAAKGTVTGSRGGNAALASLLTALVNIGLITDSSTA